MSSAEASARCLDNVDSGSAYHKAGIHPRFQGRRWATCFLLLQSRRRSELCTTYESCRLPQLSIHVLYSTVISLLSDTHGRVPQLSYYSIRPTLKDV